jgi:formamidopyrimidine-DNA glycosylase
MPELPDLTVYIEALERRILGRPLQRVRLNSPFLLRTAEPPIACVENDLWLILHLMIAGRLHWQEKTMDRLGKRVLAAFDFSTGTLTLTEAGTAKRASLFLVRGEKALAVHDPGGLEVLDGDLAAFRDALTRENHTLKRALTDPRLFSGIGNAYSDEILHGARLSPLAMTQKLAPEEIEVLYRATQETLLHWIRTLRAQTGDGFPEKVTAFRDDMKVHGRYGKPCPDCGTPIQRIRYATNETNYCPRCQTKGKVLADRSLSRLLKKDWPRSIEELERLGKPSGI